MNCALCKYREQILGFEAEVGLPQESHHHHVEGILGEAAETPSSHGRRRMRRMRGTLRGRAEGRRRNPSPPRRPLSLWERESITVPSFTTNQHIRTATSPRHDHHHDHAHPRSRSPPSPLSARRSPARAAFIEAEVKCSTTSATQTRFLAAPSRSSRRRPTLDRCRKTSGRSPRGSFMLVACRTWSPISHTRMAQAISARPRCRAARRSSATCAWLPLA